MFVRVDMSQLVIDERDRDVVDARAPAALAGVPRLAVLIFHSVDNFDEEPVPIEALSDVNKCCQWR